MAGSKSWLKALLVVSLVFGTAWTNLSHSRVQASKAARSGPEFSISFPREVHSTSLSGRLFLLISRPGTTAPKRPVLVGDDLFATMPQPMGEPRFEVNDHSNTQQMFAIDVDGLSPGAPGVIDNSTLGYPLDRLDQISTGDYDVQGLLNIYETFHRADGHTLKLPMDQGEGQQWNLKPGNLYSTVQRIHISGHSDSFQISLTKVVAPIAPPVDTKYVKHIQIESELLRKFWGRPMMLGAIVLLPEGWDEHPDSHYPLVIHHWHFRREFGTPLEFRTTPPTAAMSGYERTAAEYGYQFYQDWRAGRLPRVIVMLVQHANPYFDDSYAVNSANVGPYGDAITQELIPYVERKYRGIGQGWARAMFGYSTGGWATLGMQVFYPDFFNGAWSFCPDPVDFRATQIVNIYEDSNAFWLEGPFSRVPRPGERWSDGSIATTMDRQVRRELVLGTHGRSAEQWGIWQAVYGPVGEDGYPKQIWDPMTGVIDHSVASYWREHFDLRYILNRDWKTLGPKLVGKIHIATGTRDNFYLDNGVRLLEDFLVRTKEPYYAGEVSYGPHYPHCYFGDPNLPATIGELTYTETVLNKMARWMEKSAPAGADLKSWKY